MGSPMPMIGLAICVALGSFFGGLVTWIHYIVGFSTDVTGRQWHFTRVASRTTLSANASAAAAGATGETDGAVTGAQFPKKQVSPDANIQVIVEKQPEASPEDDFVRCAEIPVTDTYVINMDENPGRYREFMQHMSQLCGINLERIHRHSGVVASEAMIEEPWVNDLIPGVKGEANARLGSLGLALAHLTVWDKIRRSERCQLEGAEDSYALVFEDDERPRSFFADAINQVLRVVNHYPVGSRPDIINLNVKRHSGRTVASLKYPQRMHVLEINQKKRNWRTGPLCTEGGYQLHCNVWMSAYMVRCGGVGQLIHWGGRYPDGEHIYNGVTPTFDRQMSDVESDGSNPVRGWVISPTDIISIHKEGFDSRKKRDAESMQHAVAQGGKKPILNSKVYVPEELDEFFDGFEWH